MSSNLISSAGVKILAIETSCDETAIAILECTGELPRPKFEVLGNELISQIDVHKEYGGVYPMLAKREHIKNLPILLERLHPHPEEIDYICVTQGPGLEPALWTGITFAEELGKKLSKPVIGVNHMEGHMWSVLGDNGIEIRFPALALLVSGGHTELVHAESFSEFKIIGKTRDDAVGEAFDKAARLIGLPYPGGPEISKLASTTRGKEISFRFPSPMISSKDYDFSYSGLKTSVLYKIRDLGDLSEDQKAKIALAFEDAAIGVLVEKTRRALDEFGVSTLIVGGGVAGNNYLQSELKKVCEERGIALLFPPKGLTTDNALMIGIAGYIHILNKTAVPALAMKALGNLSLNAS